MTIDLEKLLALKIPDIEHSYCEKDAILYALGIGLGQRSARCGRACLSCTKKS